VYSRSFLELDVEGAMGANPLVEVNTPWPPARLRRPNSAAPLGEVDPPAVGNSRVRSREFPKFRRTLRARRRCRPGPRRWCSSWRYGRSRRCCGSCCCRRCWRMRCRRCRRRSECGRRRRALRDPISALL